MTFAFFRKSFPQLPKVTRMLLAFAMIGFLSSQETRAATVSKEECQDIDFSQRIGPVRNQANSSWCWAFSAADLIGFYQGTKEQVSAMDVALAGLSIKAEGLRTALAETKDWQYFQFYAEYLNSKFENDPFHRKLSEKRLLDRGGFLEDGFHAYNLRRRICFESELPSEPARAFQGIGSSKPFPFGEPDQSFIEQKMKSLGDSSRTEPVGSNPLLTLGLTCEDSKAIPNPFQRQLDFFQAFNQKALYEVDAKAQKRCKKGPSVKPMKTELRLFPKPNITAASIISAWLKKGSPMRVYYNSDFLDQEDWKPEEKPSMNHASVIVGMRWNPKRESCEFKLRNSWGPGCKIYAARLKDRCESGNLWISEEEANQITHGVTRIVP